MYHDVHQERLDLGRTINQLIKVWTEQEMNITFGYCLSETQLVRRQVYSLRAKPYCLYLSHQFLAHGEMLTTRVDSL